MLKNHQAGEIFFQVLLYLFLAGANWKTSILAKWNLQKWLSHVLPKEGHDFTQKYWDMSANSSEGPTWNLHNIPYTPEN